MPAVTFLSIPSNPNHPLSPDLLRALGGVDELIEVGNEEPCLKVAAERFCIPFRHVRSARGLARRLNLGISFSSGEWIAVSFGDEIFAPGWITALKGRLASCKAGALLVRPDSGPGYPLVVARREAFEHGAVDEGFPCQRLAALHWAFHILGRVSRNGGLDEWKCALVDARLPPVEHPMAALIELGRDLDAPCREALLRACLDSPSAVEQDLLFQLERTRLSASRLDGSAYRRPAGYNPKKFWESQVGDYVKWEVYQPDEPEIEEMVTRTSPQSVLELGCGAGRNTRYFSAAQRYVGVDLSMTLLQRARERQEQNSRGIVCGDISALGFAGVSFDLVFADSTLQHVTPDRIERCVADAVRVSSRYIGLIEYTREIDAAGTWFQQIHLFPHNYPDLFHPYADLVIRRETTRRVHPAVKEMFLFEKRA